MLPVKPTTANDQKKNMIYSCGYGTISTKVLKAA